MLDLIHNPFAADFSALFKKWIWWVSVAVAPATAIGFWMRLPCLIGYKVARKTSVNSFSVYRAFSAPLLFIVVSCFCLLLLFVMFVSGTNPFCKKKVVLDPPAATTTSTTINDDQAAFDELAREMDPNNDAPAPKTVSSPKQHLIEMMSFVQGRDDIVNSTLKPPAPPLKTRSKSPSLLQRLGNLLSPKKQPTVDPNDKHPGGESLFTSLIAKQLIKNFIGSYLRHLRQKDCQRSIQMQCVCRLWYLWKVRAGRLCFESPFWRNAYVAQNSRLEAFENSCATKTIKESGIVSG